VINVVVLVHYALNADQFTITITIAWLLLLLLS
jgi:hypothetical protein